MTGEPTTAAESRLGGLVGAIRLVWETAPFAGCTVLLLSAVSGVAAVPAVWLTKTLVDELAHPEAHSVTSIAGLAAAVALSGGLATSIAYLGALPAGRLAAKVQLQTEVRLARACATPVGTAFLERSDSQDTLHLARRGAHEAPTMLADSCASLVSAAFGITGYVVVLYRAWPLMIVALALTAVPIALIQRRINRRAVKVAEANASLYRWRDYYAELFSSPPSARDMRLNGSQQAFLTRLCEHLSRALMREARQESRAAIGRMGLVLLDAAIAATGAVIVALGVVHGTVTVGGFVLFTAAVMAVQRSFATVLTQTSHLSVLLGTFTHYLRFIESASAVRSPDHDHPGLPHLTSTIEFRNVWFRYPSRESWALRGINLRIAAGKMTALIGVNGAGKSTLVNLLLRYYEPTRGEILWDGVNIAAVDAGALRSRVGAVLQDVVRYELSAAENVTVGDPGCFGDPDVARLAAERAGIADALAGLPAGFDTLLSSQRAGSDGLGGSMLSSGQWQRIALARVAACEDAELLILDEPNATLDPLAEYELQASLRTIGKRPATRIMISHRLGGIRSADQIIVLHDGTVVEAGSHAELMQRSGLYARLFMTQASGYVEIEDAAS